MRILRKKTQELITHEWDHIAQARDQQLRSGADRSFSNVLKPWVLGEVDRGLNVLDVGCGTGVLTEQLVPLSAKVVGIDPSAFSVRIAESRASALQERPNYETATVEDWARGRPRFLAQSVVMNMVLMDVPSVSKALTAIAGLSGVKQVVATFTHPAFWPRYWGYDSLPDFDYSSEFAVEADFRTSGMDYGQLTTHYHRPLAYYLQECRKAGFSDIRLAELRGPESIREFAFPRFVGLHLRR